MHERGKYLTLYVLALYVANSIAPLIAGFIAAGQNWQWVLVRGSPFLAQARLCLILIITVLVRHL